MNKLVATCLESKIHVFDMRTQHPNKGFACLTEKVTLARNCQSSDVAVVCINLCRQLQSSHRCMVLSSCFTILADKKVRKRTGRIRLEKMIRERRMRWLGHFTRTDEARIPKQALHWEVAGFRRRPGRPRIKWRDVVKKDLQRMGLTCRKRLKHQLKTDIRGVNV